MKKKILISIALLAVAFGIFVVASLYCIETLRLGNLSGYPAAIFVGFGLTFLLSWASISKIKVLKPAFIALLIWFGVAITDLIYLVPKAFSEVGLESNKALFPVLISWYLGVLTGYLFCKIRQKAIGVVMLVFVCGSLTWFNLRGYDYYVDYLSYGSVTGELEEPVAVDFQLQTSEGQTIGLNDLPEEYLVLDFWFTYCGICFEQFPAVQQLYDRFGKDARVGVYGVHNRFESDKEDASTGMKLLTEEGYTFPCLSTPRDREDTLLKALGIKFYPTVLIFDKERKMIYRGSGKNVEEFMDKRLSVGQ